jgi:hypothetical protein
VSAEDNGRRAWLSVDEENGFTVWITSDEQRAPLSAGVSHLLAADDALMPGRWGAHITLCGREVRGPNGNPAEHEWGCDPRFDCSRYCPECVAEACRFSAASATSR